LLHLHPHHGELTAAAAAAAVAAAAAAAAAAAVSNVTNMPWEVHDAMELSYMTAQERDL
jgi:hypothetical protein